MELIVLVDNNTLIDRYFIGEPGLSFLLKEEDKTILFDVCYSDAFLKNAHVIGGFHLLEPSAEVMRKTCDYL